MIGVIDDKFPIRELSVGMTLEGDYCVEIKTHQPIATFIPTQPFITPEFSDLWYYEWADLLRNKIITPGDLISVCVKSPVYGLTYQTTVYQFRMVVTSVQADFSAGSIQVYTIQGVVIGDIDKFVRLDP